jgi:hypothetical protein
MVYEEEFSRSGGLIAPEIALVVFKSLLRKVFTYN